MPIRIREQVASRDGMDGTDQSSTRQLKWLVWGTYDVSLAEAQLSPSIPLLWQGLIFKGLTWEQQSPTSWLFTANYQDPKKQEDENKLEEGEFTFSFDTTGGTLHVSTNPNGTDKYSIDIVDDPPVETLGAINVDADRQPQGVDITIPSMLYRITYQFPDDHFVDFDAFLDYSKTVEELTGTTNESTRLKRAPGELLLLGGTGKWSTKSGPLIDYSIAVSKNQTGLTIGDIPAVDKKGHAYLWIWYEPFKDATAKVIIPKPRWVYVENLYKPANWDDLEVAAI